MNRSAVPWRNCSSRTSKMREPGVKEKGEKKTARIPIKIVRKDALPPFFNIFLDDLDRQTLELHSKLLKSCVEPAFYGAQWQLQCV